MNALSAALITKNEARNIRRCLDFLKWTDEIVLVDTGSQDETVRIAREYGCEVYNIEWEGFGPAKQYAVDRTSNLWVLVVDADEVVTPELRDSIRGILREPVYNGYTIRRKSFYLGKPIQYCGWGNDYVLRLFHKNHGRFDEKRVHESIHIEGKPGVIDAPLLHYTYPTVGDHVRKMELYAGLSAMRKYEQSRSVTLAGAIIRGIMKFFKMYGLQLGFMDGKPGLVLSLNSAYGVYLKYLNLWELNRKGGNSRATE